MNKKINFLIIVVSVVCVILGLFFLINNYLFYKQAVKTQAIISNIGQPDNCLPGKECQWGRRISLRIDKINSSEIQDVSTITAVTGMFSEGGKLNVLYKQKPKDIPAIEIFGADTRPILYEIRIYSWHYWGYPILLILCGPILYLFLKRILKRTGYNKILNT